MYAAGHDYIEIVKVLIESGADVTVNFNFPIRIAVKHDNVETVKLLIKAGADVAAQDNYAIRQAAENRNIEMLKILIGEKNKKCDKAKG